MRFLVQLKKTDDAAFISHLDMMRSMQRTLRRANVPICYSNGFNPHPVMSFAMPSPVGMTNFAVYMEVKVEDGADVTDLTAKFIAALPDGFGVIRSRLVEDEYPPLMSRVAFCKAELLFENAKELALKWEAFLAQDAILVNKHTKKGWRDVDIRPMILSSEVIEEGAYGLIRVRVSAGSAQNLSPAILASAFTAFSEETCMVVMRDLLAEENAEAKDLFALD